MIKLHPSHPYSRNEVKVIAGGLILCFATITVLENSIILSSLGNSLYIWISRVLMWLLLGGIVYFLPRPKLGGKGKLKEQVLLWAIIIGVVHLVVLWIAGIVDGLGKSPYDRSLLGVLTNIIYLAAMLFGREMFRFYVINSLSNGKMAKLISLSLFMTLCSIPHIQYSAFVGDTEELVIFIAEVLAPEFSKQILLTYLVYIGGPLASIAYISIPLGYHWLAPNLPDLKWITTALVGILFPIFSLMVIEEIYNKLCNKLAGIKKKENPVGWIITSIVSILIIWFAVGVFPIYPSVIATGSMEPDIKPGDVILVTKIDEAMIFDIGDVIQFQRGDILISHRIINIEEDDDGDIDYITKGDNNSIEDSEPVQLHNIKGKVTYVVPKIGILTLLLKSDKDIDMSQIEF